MSIFTKMKNQMVAVNEHLHKANIATIKLNLLWRQLLECGSCDPDYESENERAAQEEFIAGESEDDDSDWDDDEEEELGDDDEVD